MPHLCPLPMAEYIVADLLVMLQHQTIHLSTHAMSNAQTQSYQIVPKYIMVVLSAILYRQSKRPIAPGQEKMYPSIVTICI